MAQFRRSKIFHKTFKLENPFDVQENLSIWIKLIDKNYVCPFLKCFSHYPKSATSGLSSHLKKSEEKSRKKRTFKPRRRVTATLEINGQYQLLLRTRSGSRNKLLTNPRLAQRCNIVVQHENLRNFKTSITYFG